MKKRIRKCTDRCHSAKGTRCKCICQGFYHGSAGSAGAANRQALQEQTEEEVKEILEQHGFKKGEAVYLEQLQLPMPVELPIPKKEAYGLARQIAYIEDVIAIKKKLGNDTSSEEGLIKEWEKYLPGGSKYHLWIAHSRAAAEKAVCGSQVDF